MAALLSIGAAFSYALALVYARRFKAWGISPLMIAAGQVTMATLILLPITLIIDRPFALPQMPIVAIGAIIGLAFFSTVIAYILYFRLVDSAGANNAALVTFLIPISAILLGVALLQEIFLPSHGFGMAVIGLGLLIMDGRLFKWFWNNVRAKPQN